MGKGRSPVTILNCSFPESGPVDDGVALQSIAHLVAEPAHPVAEPALELNEDSLVEATVELDPDLIMKQAFQVNGVREFEESPLVAMFELCDLALKWFAIQPEIWKWRAEPAIEQQTDFETGKRYVRFYARGFFNQNVRLGDHQHIWKDL